LSYLKLIASEISKTNLLFDTERMKEKCAPILFFLVMVCELLLVSFEANYLKNKVDATAIKDCSFMYDQLYFACIIDLITFMLNFILLVFWIRNYYLLLENLINKMKFCTFIVQIPQIMCSITIFIWYFCYYDNPCYYNISFNTSEYWSYIIIHALVGFIAFLIGFYCIMVITCWLVYDSLKELCSSQNTNDTVRVEMTNNNSIQETKKYEV
jgi:hypothetical protein